MTNPLSAELYVTEFLPTGNVGEYSFTDAVFNNQADASGDGAYAVAVGYALYVPAASLATGMPIPGVLHRYRISSVNIVDSQTISGTMVWDEISDEDDAPLSGSACLLTQVSPNRRLGLVPSDELYPLMAPGATIGALRVDTQDILDQQSAETTTSVIKYTFPVSVQWIVVHNKNTRTFVESLKDASGRRLFASVEILDNNRFAVNLTEATAGSVDVVFN